MSDQTDDPGPSRPQEPPWEPAEPPPWEVVVAASAELAERPVWDPSLSCLTWVDINAGRLHRYTPGGGNDVVIELSADGRPVPIGAAAHRGSGGYVLAAADGFRLAGPDGGSEAGPWRPPDMPEDVRFNDGACDPAGRFWAGTVAHDVRPGLAHRSDQIARNLLAAAPIEDDTNFDTPHGGCGESLGKARRNLSGFIDKGRQVNALPRRSDRVQQGGEYLRSVLVEGYLVSLDLLLACTPGQSAHERVSVVPDARH